MAGLYLTPTRRRLLQHVEKQAVRREYYGDYMSADVDARENLTVTARIADAEAAGWVHLETRAWTTVDVVTGASAEVRYWALTDEGRAVLAGGAS
jgi:hypothetical protein